MIRAATAILDGGNSLRLMKMVYASMVLRSVQTRNAVVFYAFDALVEAGMASLPTVRACV